MTYSRATQSGSWRRGAKRKKEEKKKNRKGGEKRKEERFSDSGRRGLECSVACGFLSFKIRSCPIGVANIPVIT